MTVYVDSERNAFGRMIMCHMFADTLVELHVMAERIGMKRSWFQCFSFPHYDVALGRREEAVQQGAVEVDRRTGHTIRKRLREDPEFMRLWKEEHDRAPTPRPRRAGG